MRKKYLINNPDPDRLAGQARKVFFDLIQKLTDRFEKITVSLPGGRSVQAFYREIARNFDYLPRTTWSQVHFFWTDERTVPPDHKQSNYRIAAEVFLSDLAGEETLPSDNVHRFRGEAENISVQLEEYNRELRTISNGLIHIPILGVGKDGHVGSLFPNHKALEYERSGFVLIDDSPKPPSRRITIAPAHIKKSIAPFVFFIGEEKREAYQGFLDSDTDYRDFPCKLALEGPDNRTCYVVTDLET